MNRTVVVGIVLAVLGPLTIGAGSWALWSRQKDYEARLALAREESANELVASRVATGKAYLASGNWDAALVALRQARATEHATNLDQVGPLIVQAEQGKASVLLAGALSALRRRDVAEGVRLLTTYLAHPRATQKKRAERLIAQVRRATAADHAVAVLRGLRAEQLDRLGAGDTPPDGGVTDAVVRPIFLDTLRVHLPNERHRRAALLVAQQAEAQRRARERQEREKRVVVSAPYREMAELAADLGKRLRAERAMLNRQRRALARLASELNVSGEDLATLRKELDEAEKKMGPYHKTFTARRAAARKAFQALEGFTTADLDVFDQLLDRLADGLLPNSKS
jgi:hypothetical protein